MTRRRFYAPPSAFTRDAVHLDTDEARYLREVLRLKVADQVFVFNGEGREFRCTIEEARRDSSLLKVVEEIEPARPESPLTLTLAVALLKGEKFDLVVQKATELGVTAIIPVTTKLADIRLRDQSDAKKRVTRWQRIALEAAKQSGRAVVPTVGEPQSFSALVSESPPESSLRFMFSERDGNSLSVVTESQQQPIASLTALVGSEGGWTDEELSLAREHRWPIITLGGRTLRAETAAIAVTTLLQHLFGDFN
ncbi:MAG TPA: 16S rRNA (uracil(1498)-N(3))-methyltransferase [Pyrinomonadaceae bacterium]